MVLRISRAAIGLLVSLALAPAAARSAETVTIGTTDTGSNLYVTVLAIAKAASGYGIDLRPRPYKGTTQAVPFVDNGELDFGLENGLALTQAYGGTGVFEGQSLKNLRLVGTIYPFRVGMMVLDSDPAKSIADLKGRPIATVYKTSPNFNIVTAALLASAGLSVSDVDGRTVSTATEPAEAMVAGNLGASLAGLGSPNMIQLDQSGTKIRVLTTDSDDAALARLREFYPMGRLVTIDPAPGYVGILAPTVMLEYDFYIYANVNTPDSAVVALIDGMLNGKDVMTQSLVAFGAFDPQNMMRPLVGVPYHPAAEAHYKELGLWKE